VHPTAAADAAPPIPQPAAEPDPASPPSERPPAAPAPARTRPRAADAPSPLNATDPPTEVIRSGLRAAAPPHGRQTVAFDPIAAPHDGADAQKDDERPQDRP
jgi:hypothetical protein